MLPEKLVLLTAIVRRHKASSVLAKLMSTGFFHPVDAAGLSGSTENIQPLKQGFESARWKEIISRYHYITQQTHFVPSYSDVPASYIEAETSLQEIQENLNGFFEKKEEILKEISRLQPLIEKNPIYLPVPTAENFTFIHSEIGEIFPDKSMVLETLLSGIPHVVIPGEIRNNRLIIGIIILKKDIATFERVKKEIDWSSISSDISITDIPVEQYRKKIEELKAELMIVDSRIQEIVQKYAGVLSKISVSIEIYEKLVQTKKLTVMTNMTMFLSGWIPEKESQSVSELIQKTDPVCYCQFIPAEESGIPQEEIPVNIKHNKFLKPFELIVQTYGIPRYGYLDPTLFVAMSFLLMFGAMFGDIGHGAVFVMLGILFLWRFKSAMQQAGYLMVYVGISSMIFGLLYGSVFGIEFHPLWINPMKNVSILFRSCIMFGIIILTAGIVLNIINNAINRKRDAVLFDKAGLFSGVIFWAGAALAAAYITKAEGVILKILASLLVTGIVAIFLKSLFDAIKHREGVFVGFIEGVLHIFEIMMGYLANTVSFIRISAFTLNHFSFFITIFAISDMIRKAGAGWLSWIAIVLGNIFVILLEGLVVLIQSLRLNYYEFFSRFFVTGKYIYQPVVLKGMIEKVDEYLA